MKKAVILLAILGFIGFVFSCASDYPPNPTSTGTTTTTTTKSSAKAITNFSFATLSQTAAITVDETNKKIAITVPSTTDLTKLVPTIVVSDKATLSPVSGLAQDFTNSITYTVTAEDGSTAKYVVTVTKATSAKSSEKAITSFSFAALSPAVLATIDEANKKITASVPSGTDITKLVPTIVGSAKATFSPASGIAQDFTNAFSYTVKAEDGSTATYVVTVAILKAIDAAFIAVPDVNFEKALIALKIDDVQDGKLLKANAEKITSLYVSEKSITTLEGIAAFVGLQYLQCNNNKLTQLDLSQNTKLLSIDCSSNLLGSLDISKNTLLGVLDVGYNTLTEINATKNIKMWRLWCSNNQLTSITLNTALTDLDCGDNKLTAIDVSKNTVLQYFDCPRNQLSALNVSKNTDLIRLKCNVNKLTSLDVSKNMSLTTLWSVYNNIVKICVSNLTQVGTDWEKDNTATYVVCP